MTSRIVGNVALTLQLLSASAGLCLATPYQSTDPSGQVTADQQKMNKADRELTQKIRKSVVSDKSLSISAHNVKIISQDGAVTLKGEVKSDDEKKSIEDKANQIAGAGKVTSELTVASK
jgi:osmotically-inducible protein OsmY